MQTLFPHDEIRPVQGEFMQQVEKTLEGKSCLIAHCPTGTGKTAAVITPALSFALKNKLTVFFLTSRHTQHAIAIETLMRIRKKHNANFTVVDLVGKKFMCAQPGIASLTSSEFNEFCREVRERGKCEFFNSIRKDGKLSFDAQRVLQELKNEPCHVEQLNKKSIDARLCPYEMACHLGKEANVIIADYYHFLHPHIRANLMKRMGKSVSDSIVIMDEGHNLPARARKLLSQTLAVPTLYKAAKEARQQECYDTEKQLLQLAEAMDKMAEALEKRQEMLVTKQQLVDAVEKITKYDELCANLHFIAEDIIEEKKRSFAASVANFLESWMGPDASFVRIMSRSYSKIKPFVTFSYKCLDPSIALNDVLADSHSVILMSGTLTPTEMYRDILGFKQDKTSCAEYGNPFPKENRLNIIVPKTSTKFTVRSPKMYEMIARECANVVNAVPGNCAVFFPSYEMLSQVYFYLQYLCGKTIFQEASGMGKEEKAELLGAFKSYKDVGAVLLGVSAGSFGEGIDLMGDFLKSVMVVGLPLTKPDLETEELIKHYDKKFGKGWDYGYVLPAIITTMQNAGRCIRSATDRGVIVFLDERYVWKRYYDCFPRDWAIKVTTEAVREINKFYGNSGKSL